MNVAVVTSGGDAPGMNAAIRAVVRTVVAGGGEAVGVRHGYAGLVAGDFVALGAREVGGIIERGGTVLGSARCAEFREEAGRRKAAAALGGAGIDAIVVIGGNGSQTGAHALSGLGVRVNGVASTIDNDLCGTDVTLGVDTALNVALESIDRLRTTAVSHDRVFLVEVMGRDSGFLAVAAAITGGAEAVVVPEAPASPEVVADALLAARGRGKRHAVVIVAEGVPGGVGALAGALSARADLGLTSAPPCSGTCSAAGRLAPSIACSVPARPRGGSGPPRGGPRPPVRAQRGVVRGVPLADVAGKTRALDPALLVLAEVMER